MREPLSSGTGDRYRFPRFFVCQLLFVFLVVALFGNRELFAFMVNRELHIGELVRKELKKQERTIAWLARKLNCTRSNIYDIFSRKDIDVFLLIRLSRILRHNFLRDLAAYADALSDTTPDDDAPLS